MLPVQPSDPLADPPYWLLGLPFDAIGMEEAVRQIQNAVRTRRRLVVATPNVNFVAMARADASFRDTLLDAQLSLVDGMTLVWVGRRGDVPFPERVAGSSLLERLAADRARPLRAHIFGGQPGIAERAASRLQVLGSGLVSAGFTDPGFGSVESMGTPELLRRINDSNADLLVLALGAKKGHEWIARHQSKIDVPVISHLGATVNFIAGTVARAPDWMQKSGLEWVWRILQEPYLVQRYWNDGRVFLRMLRQRADSARLAAAADPGRTVAAIRAALALPTEQRVLDVAELGALDPRTLGLLYAWRHRLPDSRHHRLRCSSPQQLALLRRLRADCLLTEPDGATAGTQ